MSTHSGGLWDIPTLWNFSGCFISKMLFNWVENYNLLNNIPLLFPEKATLFEGLPYCSFSLSLFTNVPLIRAWSHELLHYQKSYISKRTLSSKLRFEKIVIMLVSQVKLHTVNTFGWLHSQQYFYIRSGIKFNQRNSIEVHWTCGAVQEKFSNCGILAPAGRPSVF